MQSQIQHFSTLSQLIPTLHDLFDQWEGEQHFTPPLNADTFQCAKLVVHEWMANLVQHADFADRQPAITLMLKPGKSCVEFSIWDNSEGFDIASIAGANESMEVLRDRGFGLLIIYGCAHNLSYRKVDSGGQQFTFCLEGNALAEIDLPIPELQARKQRVRTAKPALVK